MLGGHAMLSRHAVALALCMQILLAEEVWEMRQLCIVAPRASVCCRALNGEPNMGLVGSSLASGCWEVIG